jgi:hypothetical protein
VWQANSPRVEVEPTGLRSAIAKVSQDRRLFAREMGANLMLPAG